MPWQSELAPALSFFEVQPYSSCPLKEVSKTRSQVPTSAMRSLAKAHESQYQKQEKVWAAVFVLLQLYDAHTAPPVNNLPLEWYSTAPGRYPEIEVRGSVGV